MILSAGGLSQAKLHRRGPAAPHQMDARVPLFAPATAVPERYAYLRGKLGQNIVEDLQELEWL